MAAINSSAEDMEKFFLFFPMGHLRAMNHHAGVIVVTDFFGGEGAVYYVLGEVGYPGFIIPANADGVIHAKTEVCRHFIIMAIKASSTKPSSFNIDKTLAPVRERSETPRQFGRRSYGKL